MDESVATFFFDSRCTCSFMYFYFVLINNDDGDEGCNIYSRIQVEATV